MKSTQFAEDDRVLPNFIVIGSMKAGTTSLYQYLRAHPQVFMPDNKEPNYFAEPEKDKQNREWYEDLFRNARGASAVGEASTSYTRFPSIQGVPERIAKLLPEARLVYLVRHPIRRIQSHYIHWRRNGRETRPIGKALTRDRRYVDFSRYWMQLTQYLDWFPPDQILVVQSEAMMKARRESLMEICAFLGIDQDRLSETIDTEFNQTSGRSTYRPAFARVAGARAFRAVSRIVPDSVKATIRPKITQAVEADDFRIPPAVARSLEQALRDDVEALGKFMGSAFDEWGLG